jgi:hypothetical protein
VWRFVAGLDLAPLYAGIKAVAGRPGHPPADPRLLVALWLYATRGSAAPARWPGCARSTWPIFDSERAKSGDFAR